MFIHLSKWINPQSIKHVQFPLCLNTCPCLSEDFTAQFWKHRCEISSFYFKTRTLFYQQSEVIGGFLKKNESIHCSGEITSTAKINYRKMWKFWFCYDLHTEFLTYVRLGKSHVEISLKGELMLRVWSTERDLKKNKNQTCKTSKTFQT